MTADATSPTPLHAVLLRVAYLGTHFHGWQRQPGQRTVEETLHGALLALDPEVSAPRGTSRTDAGVHARAQYVAFDSTRAIASRGWVLGTNQHLPEDVAIRSAQPVPVGYNPRFANRGKRYEYLVQTEAVRDPFRAPLSWRVGAKLDLAAMIREAAVLVGTHDFAAFRSAADERENTVRTIHALTVERIDGDAVVRFAVEGNGFMHNMVRILVGTLVDIGLGRLPAGRAREALESKDRRLAGMTAPPHGLCLARVDLDVHAEAAEAWP
jgi:tRNA pseudouridine38-40 synthase